MNSARRAALHAKCVVIDRSTALVTSANFTEAAQERNIEAGALVSDVTFAGILVDQFDWLVRIGAVERLPLG
jgi:phosphatidylserine/phosphatidylglycerophosphate/cardiolipin synthase-like enzyme